MIACACGCGTDIPAIASDGSPRKYLQGHQNRKRLVIPTRLCECGCQREMPSMDNKGRPRRFIKGHHAGQPGSVNALAKYRGNRTGVIPWNKGKTYVFSKRAVYANRSSWMKALRRVFGDKCMRCGWDEASCDAHHIIERCDGGAHTLENGIILCPNCHRLSHTKKLQLPDLLAIRAAAVEINQAV